MFATLHRTIRTLRRAPGFVAVATLSLAVGIGLSTATFAFVDSALNPKIPLADIDRLFVQHLRLGDQRHPPSILEQVNALAALPGVERATVMATSITGNGISVDGAEKYAYVSRTTPDFFATLGVVPTLGRLPSEEETRQQSAVLVTADVWHLFFPKRDSLAGAVITIADRDYSVIGVLPIGVERIVQGGIFIPAISTVELQNLRWPMIIAKLRRGTDSLAIQAQLAAVAANFTAAYTHPPTPAYELRLKGIRPKQWSIRDNELALLMVGIALGILMIACTNVSALALARGLTRRRDFALRIALGSSRAAIGGEVLFEVLIIALFGTALGFLFAIALVGVLMHLVPEDLQWAGYFIPVLNPRVFAMSTLSLIAGIAVAGGVPAWRASRANPSASLKDNAGTTTGRARSEFKFLVMAELAVAMALLMLASLVTLSTRNLMRYDFGFDARSLVAATIQFPGRRDSLPPERKEQLVMASIERLKSLPGVASVSYSDNERLDGDVVTSDATREAQPLRMRNGYFETGPNFFATTGIRLLAGRDITESDRTRGAVVLTQQTAALLFPHGDAVGRMVKLGGERSAQGWLPVVGVARDIHLDLSPNTGGNADTALFAMSPAHRFGYTRLVVRPTHVDPALNVEIAKLLRAELPPRVYASVTPFVDIERLMQMQKFFDQVFTFLGTAALLLAAAGLFSVLSYTVGQRLREFAVRQALGASPRDVLALVMRGAFELALGGTAFGALLSFWASAGVSASLFGVKNTDPVSLVVAEGTLLIVTMLASLLPAIRAMRSDPTEVLRAT